MSTGIRPLLAAVFLMLGYAGVGGCGRLGFDFRQPDGGSDDGGQVSADAGNDGGSDAGSDGGNDGGPDAGLAACSVGTPAYPSVQSALDDASCEVVDVPAGTFTENLSVTRTVRVVGAGIGSTTLDGGGGDRVIAISAAGDLQLEELTVSGGMAAVGAGIDALGPLSLTRVEVTGNSGTGVDIAGAGIAAHGVDVVVGAGSTVSANTLTAIGGASDLSARGAGVFIEGAGVLTLVDGSTVSTNIIEATLDGGAADIRGGGVAIASGARLEATDGWVVSGNRVELSATVSPSMFSEFRGGGIDCQGGTLLVSGGGAVSNNTVLALSTEPFLMAGRGGGMALEGCTASLSGTVIDANTVDATSKASGGGVDSENSTVAMNGVAITGNTVRGSWTMMTISSPLAFGGGLHVRSGNVALSTSIVATNSLEADSTSAGGPAVGGGVSVTAPISGATALTITSSLIGPGNQVVSTAPMGSAINAVGGGLGVFDSLGSDAIDVFVLNSTLSSNGVEGTGSAAVDRVYGGGVGVLKSRNTPVDVRLIHCTVTANSADGAFPGVTHGGGVAATSALGGQPLTLQNSIVHANTVETGGDADCWMDGVTVAINAGAFIGVDTGCAGDLTDATVGVDPLLGPLQDNGGGSSTHAIAPASPARDTAPAAGCQDTAGSALTQDQRGMPRDATCDHGAFEVQ